MSHNKRNVMVGVVVLAALGVLAWMILKFANQAANFFLTRGTHVVVLAERADGLAEGSAVYYRGVSVGRVLGVGLAQDQTVRIDIIIDENQRVPADVEGIIRTGNLLSASASVFLEPVKHVAAIDPSATAPTSDPSRLLAEGDVLRATIPSGSPILPEGFNDTLRELQERKLIQHLDETVVTIRDQAVKAGKLMDSVRELTDDQAMRDDLRASIDNVRALTEQANRIAANVEKVSHDFDDISSEVKGTVTDVRATVARGGKHMDSVAKQLNDRMEQVGEVLERFQAIAASVEGGEGTAGMLVKDAKLYDSLASTAAELNLMVVDLRRLVQQWEEEGLSLNMK